MTRTIYQVALLIELEDDGDTIHICLYEAPPIEYIRICDNAKSLEEAKGKLIHMYNQYITKLLDEVEDNNYQACLERCYIEHDKDLRQWLEESGILEKYLNNIGGDLK